MTTAALAPAERAPGRMATAVVLIAGAFFLLLTLVSYLPAQVTGVGAVRSNLCGTAGAWIARLLIEVWGVGAFYLPVAILGASVLLLLGRTEGSPAMRLTGTVLLLPVLCALVHLLPEGELVRSLERAWDQVHYHGLGGRLGFLLTGPAGIPEAAGVMGGELVQHPGGLLRRHLDTGGSLLVLLVAMVGCLFLMRINLIAISLRVVRAVKTQRIVRSASPKAPQRAATLRDGQDDALEPEPKGPHDPNGKAERHGAPTPTPGKRITVAQRTAAKAQAAEAPTTRQVSSVDEVARKIHNRDSTTSIDAKDLVERIRARRRALEESARLDAAGDDAEPTEEPMDTQAETAASATREASAPSAASDPAAETPAREPTPVRPAAAAPKPKPKPAPRPRTAPGDYELPSVGLLEDAPESNPEAHEAEVDETSRSIQDLFGEFNIQVKVVNSTRGPVITQYELELLDAGLRVNKLTGFEKDLSLRLGTEGIRIVAPLPNKKTIGIEVPNRIKEPVVMKDLVEETDPNQIVLPLIIGRDVLGDAMVGDLAKMPHLLIAGATGMGKSVCLNAIISSVLLFRGPEEVKFIMVDPKMVELAPYEGIPHLLTPPITDMSKAHAALEWACKEMDERFFALRMTGVRDIISYNQLGEQEIQKRLAKKGKDMADLGIEAVMPWIVIVVDEFADLMMVNKEVEKSIIRLCAKSRACGIHVILATQRPSADVVTGLIKSNMPSRICFRVADKNNSRVVLDHGGAENLLGRGDMLYLPPGSSSLIRGQGVWVKDEEIQGIIDHALSQGEPEYDDSIFSAGAAAMAGGGGGVGDGDNNWLADRQFHEAVWNLYRANKTGADFLRRRLGVGYNKATKYIEYMEDLGFLSEAKGSRPREFLKSWDDWIDELKVAGLSWEEDDEIYINPLNL